MSALLDTGATPSLYAFQNGRSRLVAAAVEGFHLSDRRQNYKKHRKEVNDHGQIYVHTYAAGREILD